MSMAGSSGSPLLSVSLVVTVVMASCAAAASADEVAGPLLVSGGALGGGGGGPLDVSINLGVSVFPADHDGSKGPSAYPGEMRATGGVEVSETTAKLPQAPSLTKNTSNADLIDADPPKVYIPAAFGDGGLPRSDSDPEASPGVRRVVEAYPNPWTQFKNCGMPRPSYICDPDGVLSPEAREHISEELFEIRERTSMPCDGTRYAYQV